MSSTIELPDFLKEFKITDYTNNQLEMLLDFLNQANKDIEDYLARSNNKTPSLFEQSGNRPEQVILDDIKD